MAGDFLFLVRHGNTFETGQTPVMVGAKTDMPLTREGEEQAKAVLSYLLGERQHIDGVRAGPLLRTRRFAEIISAGFGLNVETDKRLREIDYGLWEGLDAVAVREKYGQQLLEGWEKHGEWPEGMGWTPARLELERRLEKFLEDMKGKTTLAVTSNGILRLVFSIVTGSPPDVRAKVGTGNTCLLRCDEEKWEILHWNRKPDLV